MAARRVQNLDVLRGVAAMSVLVDHVVGRVTRADPGGALASLKPIVIDYFDLGRFGVVLFFLISGYVIPMSFRGTAPLRTFVLSRAFRLYPAYWLSVIAMVAAMTLDGWHPDMRLILANLTMAYPAFHEPAITGVYWTLIIELLFYGVAAGLFVLGCLERPMMVAAVALASIASAVLPILEHRAGHAVPLSLLGYHLAFLLLGSLLRQALAGDRAARTAALVVGLSLAATLPLVAGMFGDPGIQFSIAYPVGAIGAVAAALCVFLLSFDTRFKAAPAGLLKLGAWSYSIYLFHEPFAEVGLRLVNVGMSAGLVAYLLFVAVATLALAALVFRYVELPSIAIGKRLAHGWSTPAAAPADAGSLADTQDYRPSGAGRISSR